MQRPIEKGIRKVVVIGPVATPPESKAIDVNILGVKKESDIAKIYPGIKKYIIGIPKNMRIIDNPTAKAILIERLNLIAFQGIEPSVRSDI